MQQHAIEDIDRAAVELIRALDAWGEELAPYLGSDYLSALRDALIHLRSVLLGSQMGTLYPPEWEVPADLLELLTSFEEETETATELLNQTGAVQ